MFELIIKKQDATIYWKEFFNTLSQAEKWLEEEKTRPYWNHEFTTEILDRTPPPPTQEELDAIALKKAQAKTLADRVKALLSQPDLTAAEVKEAVIKLGKFLVARDIV